MLLVVPNNLNSSRTTVGDMVASVQRAMSRGSREVAQERRLHERLISDEAGCVSKSTRPARECHAGGERRKQEPAHAQQIIQTMSSEIAQMNHVREVLNQSMVTGFRDQISPISSSKHASFAK